MIPQNAVVLGADQIGTASFLETKLVYIDVAGSRTFQHVRAFVIIDVNGNITPLFEAQFGAPGQVLFEYSGIPPPKNLIPVEDLVSAPKLELKDAFIQLRNILRKVVDFYDENFYDLVTAYTMYTWVRGLFHKNVNLYVTGFFATGKSQVARFVKKFARYPIDYDIDFEKSGKWYLAQTLGTLVIDEAEMLTKRVLAKLRRKHELTFETRMIGLQNVGLTQITLRVDAPIVISATHLPADIAFLQRGFLIRMRKGHPEIKSLEFIEDVEDVRIETVKSVLCDWFKIFEERNNILEELQKIECDERAKDIALPIMTILKVCGRPYQWVLEYALRSIKEAFFATPETVLFTQLVIELVHRAQIEDNYYIIKYKEVYELCKELVKKLGANPSKVNYLIQYIYAGCEICQDESGELYFKCHRETVDELLRILK